MDRVVEGKKYSIMLHCIFTLCVLLLSVICGFCLLSLLMIGVFVYYLHKKNRKVATGNYSPFKIIVVIVDKPLKWKLSFLGISMNKSDADVALVDHSSVYEKKVKI